MLYSLLYVLFNTFSAVLRQLGGNNFSPSMILFTGCIFATICFNFINIKYIGFIYQSCLNNKKLWLQVNFSAALMWLCAIYGPSYAGASLYTFLVFTVLGLLGSLSLFHHSEKNVLRIISITGLVCLLVGSLFENVIHADLHKLFGILLACASGIITYIYSVQSFKFSQAASFNSSQILAVRLYMAILFSAILIPHHVILHMGLTNLFFATCIGVLPGYSSVFFTKRH